MGEPRRGTLRFPLLVGTGALRTLAFPPAVVLLLCAVFSTIYLEGPDWPDGDTWRKVGFLGPVIAVVLFLSPLALLGWLGRVRAMLADAVRTRACDLLLSDTGLAVVGGRADGFLVGWDELRGAVISWSDAEGLSLGVSGRTLTIPAPRDAQERESLRSVAETLIATRDGVVVGAPRREPPGVVACVECAAPLAPATTALAECGHCHTQNELPSALVEKARALTTLRREQRRDERRLRMLRRQPGPWAANAVAFVAGGAVLLGGIVAAFVTAGFGFVDGRQAGMPRMHGAWLGVGGACLLLIGASSWLLATRRALRLLTLGFSARAPARDGEPMACRECAGPLPEPAAGQMLLACVYCHTTNVRALDARLHAAMVTAAPQAPTIGPRDVLGRVARRRMAAAVVFVAGLASIAAGAAWRLAYVPLLVIDLGAVEVPFEPVPVRFSPAPVEPGPDASAIHRVGRFGDAVLALLPGPGSRLDVVAMFEGETRVYEHGAQAPWLVWRAGPTLWTRAPGGVAALLPTGLTTFDEAGTAHLRHRFAELEDPRAVALSADAGAGFLVTTRASSHGHLRLRQLDGRGAPIVHEDVREAAVHPDGTRVAVTVVVDERFHLVMLTSLAAPGGRLLTRGRGHVSCPTWSPDGTALAFLSEPVRDESQYSIFYGRRALFALDLETNALLRLTQGTDLARTCPAWTSDGLFVVATEQEHPTAPFVRTLLRVER